MGVRPEAGVDPARGIIPWSRGGLQPVPLVPPGYMLGTEVSLVDAFNSENGQGILPNFPLLPYFLNK